MSVDKSKTSNDKLKTSKNSNFIFTFSFVYISLSTMWSLSEKGRIKEKTCFILFYFIGVLFMFFNSLVIVKKD